MKSKILLFLFALSISLCYGQRTTVQDLVIKKSISQSGVCTVSSFSIDQNNLAIDNGCHIYKISASTPITLSGIVAQTGGRTIKLINTSVNAITLPHESSSSTAANRFSIAGQGQVVMGQNSTVELWYDDSTSRWIVMSANVSVIETVPAPSAVTGLTSSAVTSNSATISWDPCEDCDFVLVTMRNPDSNPLDPTDNVSYSASSVFGSGDQIGENNYVIHNGTGTSVDVTGLGIVTPYSLRAYAYNQNGGTINYDKTLITSSAHSFTTLASATTPTTPYTITSVLTKEDSIIITGTAGNGTNRAVLMAENKEVDDFFVDDQSYSADDFGHGDEIGTGNFVVFDGTTESPLRLAGFERDKEYSNPYIAEYTSDKYLLPPANGPPEFTELLRTAFIYEEEFATGGTSAGETYLTTSARLFYDFTELTGTDGASVSNGNAGLEDLSPSANTATIIGTPTVEDLTVGSATVKALGDLNDEAVNTNSDGTGLFDSSFEIFFTADFSDGVPASSTFLYGVLNTSSDLIQVLLDNTGDLEFYYKSTGQGTVRFDTTDPVFSDGATGLQLIRYRYDYSGNAISLWINENPIPLTKVSSTSVSDHNPANWSSALDLYVAALNNAGTASTNPSINYVTRFAITGLLTSQQATDVSQHLRLIATSDFDNLIVHETAGFTYSVSNDSLILSGNPAGFEDYIYHVDFLPDSLGEFKQEIVVTVDDELQSGDSGLGLILVNDVATESNSGVIGLLITNPASANFGRVQIYSGSGTVDASAFSFRSQSSGAFLPEKDSSYLFTLERDIQGNDAFYSFTVMDLYDSAIITTAWTEPNRTSDEFYGSTMRAGIYMNGGPFRIKPFTLRRTGPGDESGEPTPPFDADLFVSKSGSDANDCGEADPCLTVNRLAQRIGELSPTVTDAFIGTGTYTETSFLNWPTNTGEVVGAGQTHTFITGTSSLYSFTDRSNQSSFLFQLISGSSTNVTTHFRSMTIDGARTAPLDATSIKGGVAVRNRHGVKLSDITIKNTNTCGVRLWDVDEFEMDNFLLENCSGVQSTFTHYMLEFGSAGSTGGIGGSSLISSDVPTASDDFNIKITNGTFRGQQIGEGAGWGTKGGSGSDRYVHNVLGQNLIFDVTGQSTDDTGHHFNVEWNDFNLGHILFDNVYFNTNISFGTTGLAYQDGYTRITNSTWNIQHPTTFIMEMQISKVVIDHNLVVNARNGCFISTNNTSTWHLSVDSRFRSTHGDWDIYNNIIGLSTNSGGYGVIGGTNWPVTDVKFRNNTIRYTTTSGGAWRVVVVDDTAGSNLTGLVVENNLFLDPFPSTSTFWGLVQGPISGGISRYNRSTHLVTNQSRTGVTNSNNGAPAGSGNPFTLGLGTIPTTWDEAFNGDYYRPQAGSVLIDAGQGSVTIGALEED